MKRNFILLRILALVAIFATSAMSADENGKENAEKGTSTDIPSDYLKLGDFRLINNDWGAQELKQSGSCDSKYKVFVEDNGTFGWDFDRPGCGDDNGAKPDYPEVEFGIHPFGIGDHLATSPEFSSTDLLPKKIKDIESGEISVENLTINPFAEGGWNMNFEMWFSDGDPTLSHEETNAFGEIMVFWGWNNGRWECDKNPPTIQNMGNTYTLCHLRNGRDGHDGWGDPSDPWEYYQFRLGSGQDHDSKRSFTGALDIKALLQFLVDNYGYSEELWVTRVEIGTEISDNTGGTLKMDGISVTINGETRTAEFFDPNKVESSSSEPSSSEASSSSSESSSEGESSSEDISSSTEESSDEEESSSSKEESSSEEESSEDTSPLTLNNQNLHTTTLLYRVSNKNTINYSTQNAGVYTLKVYDITGTHIETLSNQQFSIGNHPLTLNNSHNGLYLIQATKH